MKAFSVTRSPWVWAAVVVSVVAHVLTLRIEAWTVLNGLSIVLAYIGGCLAFRRQLTRKYLTDGPTLYNDDGNRDALGSFVHVSYLDEMFKVLR